MFRISLSGHMFRISESVCVCEKERARKGASLCVCEREREVHPVGWQRLYRSGNALVRRVPSGWLGHPWMASCLDICRLPERRGRGGSDQHGSCRSSAKVSFIPSKYHLSKGSTIQSGIRGPCAPRSIRLVGRRGDSDKQRERECVRGRE